MKLFIRINDVGSQKIKVKDTDKQKYNSAFWRTLAFTSHGDE